MLIKIALPNLFQWHQEFQLDEPLATWNKYYILVVEFTQISSNSLLNGCMTAEQKIMKIKRVQGINYSLKSYSSGKACEVKIASDQHCTGPQLNTSLRGLASVVQITQYTYSPRSISNNKANGPFRYIVRLSYPVCTSPMRLGEQGRNI
jgi:hypothetical protein